MRETLNRPHHDETEGAVMQYRLEVEHTNRTTAPWSATFADEGWYVETRRFADLIDAARGVAVSRTGLDPVDVVIHIDSLIIGGRDVQAEIHDAQEARRQADIASRKATNLTRSVVQHLRENLTIREAGAVVGLAPQRISAIEQQILKGT